MFTSWDQVEEWIRDNNFAHWIIYRERPSEGEKNNNIIVDSKFYTADDADKIAMTKKYLLAHGGRGFAVGFATPNTTVGGVVAEIRLEGENTQSASVNGLGGYNSKDELRESITREIRAQIKAEEYEREKKQFEKEKAGFEAEKQSTIGALVHYFAPIGQMLMEKKFTPMARVAGIDAEQDVHARRIVAEDGKPVDEQKVNLTELPAEPAEQQEPFTDEEAEQLMALMVRFKAVEPNYLQLIEAVVKMAESGDGMYNMAKGMLLK